MISQLASQHHASEYNLSKFGANGSPIKYLPISLQLPDLFKQLKLRQLQSSNTNPWWHCNKIHSPVFVLGPSGAQSHQSTLLEEQIQAAILAPLTLSHSNEEKQVNPSVKTSSTHPINISSIIPPELIPLISSQLCLSSSSQPPTVFNIPPLFALDHLLSSSQRKLPVRLALPRITVKRHTPASVTEALQAAITSDISASYPGIKRTTSNIIPSSTIIPRPSFIPAHGTLHSNASSVSLTLSLSISEPSPLSATEFVYKPRFNYAPLAQFQSPTIDTLATSDPSTSRLIPVPQPSLSVGNLFLSSCPGKKVRLQGSVKGRSGVCRDLDTDLKRIKGLGVGCIVCCLDDAELEFLGVPWPEYEECARKNEMDVLRLPTPEGLAPLAPAFLDTHLTDLINTFTLRGVHVLIHCRGGVGRAGVVACCWLIKLGLCGWVEPAPCKPSSGRSDPIAPDTVRFVEKIIAVVRKRRSMKAIETYEQVSFLVDFVHYLREGRT